MTARFAAVHVDLRRALTFREQYSAVATAMTGAPLGTRCVLTVSAVTPCPPDGWLAHAIMPPGYEWVLAGDRRASASWLRQYERETARAQPGRQATQ